MILDVVYNHFGPDGNYLRAVLARVLHASATSNEWGDGAQLRRPDAGPVREFFVANAGYWIDEFHLDGLRLDATQAIYDASPEHMLAAIARPRARGGRRARRCYIVAENEPQDARLVRPAGGAAATASTRCGTTTSTTPRAWR